MYDHRFLKINTSVITFFSLDTQDYVSSNEVRVFSPTMTSHTIEVSLLDDGIFELNEVFIGNLALLSSAGMPPVRIDFSTADITIIDDDCEENFNYTESPAIKIMMIKTSP